VQVRRDAAGDDGRVRAVARRAARQLDARLRLGHVVVAAYAAGLDPGQRGVRDGQRLARQRHVLRLLVAEPAVVRVLPAMSARWQSAQPSRHAQRLFARVVRVAAGAAERDVAVAAVVAVREAGGGRADTRRTTLLVAAGRRARSLGTDARRTPGSSP
jgi:hypothetical protein